LLSLDSGGGLGLQFSAQVIRIRAFKGLSN